jgi:DnaJ-class molecular chaperone
MQNPTFIDHYENLEISPNADASTIERVFRHLAGRYHPDNKETSDRTRFDLVIEAHDVLRDPERRAAYDVQYKSHSKLRWRLAEEAGNGSRARPSSERGPAGHGQYGCSCSSRAAAVPGDAAKRVPVHHPQSRHRPRRVQSVV